LNRLGTEAVEECIDAGLVGPPAIADAASVAGRAGVAQSEDPVEDCHASDGKDPMCHPADRRVPIS
jgi:hypothetical protein